MAAVVSLTACWDDDPVGPDAPDLVGTFQGAWTHTISGEGLETTVRTCAGDITVTEQSGAVFNGVFSQTASEDCDEASGFVDGIIRSDGTMTVILGASGGGGSAFEESTGCTIVSAAPAYAGTYVAGTISLETSLTARCPGTGDADVMFTFAFDSA